ncbi:MAG: hypothetical protein ACW98F_20385, partial [Candidatus Hodarchaeales archaeon]
MKDQAITTVGEEKQMEEGSPKEVTIAKMISLGNKSVELPYIFVQKLIQDSRETFGDFKFALTMLNGFTKILKIIPTASENIIQIGVNLRSDLPRDILENLNQIYIEEKLKTIYSVPWVCY